jgi:probable phosphoglycerate mutase
MTIYLIRHGRTNANGHYYAGHADIPLNITGLKQARAISRSLAEHRIDAVLSSPLQRALQTAAPLAQAKGLKVEIVPALAELDFGQLQGKPKTRLAIRKAHLRDPIEGGEALSDLWRRLKPVATRLLAPEGRQLNTAVVCHFWSLRLLAGLLAEKDIEAAASSRDFRLPNGAIIAVNTVETAPPVT